MSDVNVGGVTAELALGFQDWTRGLDSALKALSTFASGIGSLMDRFERTVDGGSKQAGQSLQTFSDTATRELQEVTRSVHGVGASMATEFRAAAAATQQGNAAIATALSAVTRVLEKVDDRVDRLAQQVDKSFEQMAREVVRSSNQMDATLEALGGEMSALAGDVRTQTDRIDDAFDKMAREAKKSSRETAEEAGKIPDAVRDGAERIGTAGKWLAGTGVAMETALGGVVLGALQAANEVEGFQVQLETLTGSADVARQKLDFFRSYAVKSPFELKELVDAGVQLEAYGQQAEKWLPRVGDFAASMNLDVVEAARGVGKALSGSPEGWEILRNAGVGGRRLAPFGASLTKEGNVDATDPRNADALLQYLDALEGASDKKSETIGGRWSMVADALSQAFAKLGTQLAPIAKQVADALTAIITAVGQLPPAVLQWGLVIAGAAAGLAILTGGLLMLAPVIAAIPAAFTAVSAALSALAPYIAPVVIAMAALVAGVAALGLAWAKNWGDIRSKTMAVVDDLQNFFAGFWPQVVEGFEALRVSVIRAWLQLWQTAKVYWNRFRAEIEPGLVAVRDFFARIWPEIQAIVDVAMAVLVPLVQHGMRNIQIQFEAVTSVLGALWSGLWSEMKAVYQIVWPIISGLIEGNLKWLRGVFEAALKLLTGDWSGAWDTLKKASADAMQVVQDRLGQSLDRILEALWNFIPSMVEVGGNIGSALWQAIKSAITSDQEAWQDIQTQANAVAAGRGFSSNNYGGQLAGWLAYTQAKGAENRRVAEQQALVESYRTKGEERRRRERAQAQGDSDATPQGDGPARKSDKTRSSSKLTTSQMLAYIRQHSDVSGDIANMQAASIEATYNLVQNATAEGIRLALTSGRRYGKGGSHHNAGNALDVQVPGYADGSTEAGAIVRALAKGTGWQSGINEYLPQARAITGGTGPHVHLARALDGVGIPGHFRVDASGGKKAGATEYRRALEELQRWREQVKALGQDHESLGSKLAEIDARYAKMATEGQALGASQADLAKVEAARQAEHLAAWTEYADKQKTILAEMSAERLDLTADETEREREELRKRFEAMVDHWQKVATETPALAAQAEEQVALIQRTYRDQRAEFERKAEEKRIQDAQAAWEQKHQKELESQEFLLKTGQETNEGLLAFLAQQLEAWQGTEEGKRTLALRYREAFLEDLRVRREAQDAYDVADLERELAQLQAKTDLTVAEEVRRDALLAEVQEAQSTRLAEIQQRAQGVADALRNSFQQAFTGVLSGQQSFAQGFKSIWDAVKQAFLQAIAEMIIETKAFQAVLMALKAAMNAIGGIFGGLFGFHTGGVVEASGMPYAVAHTGGLLGPGGELQSFHSGGSVGRVQLRPDEVLAKLQTGEIVLSRDNVRSLGSAGSVGSGGGVSVVINAPGLVVREEADIDRFTRALGGEAQWRLGLV